MVLGERGKKALAIAMVCGPPKSHSTSTDRQSLCGIKVLRKRIRK